jgi:hypothetical protein
MSECEGTQVCTRCRKRIPEAGYKRCSVCRDKNEEWYSATRDKRKKYAREYRSNRPGLSTRYNRNHYERHGVEIKARKYDERRLLRIEIFAAYGGPRCSCCGESESLFLTIDHIENNGADHRRKDKRNLYERLKQQGFPPGFQVLCRNCNWGKHANGGVCPHLTRAKEIVI